MTEIQDEFADRPSRDLVVLLPLVVLLMIAAGLIEGISLALLAPLSIR